MRGHIKKLLLKKIIVFIILALAFSNCKNPVNIINNSTEEFNPLITTGVREICKPNIIKYPEDNYNHLTDKIKQQGVTVNETYFTPGDNMVSVSNHEFSTSFKLYTIQPGPGRKARSLLMSITKPTLKSSKTIPHQSSAHTEPLPPNRMNPYKNNLPPLYRSYYYNENNYSSTV